MTDTTLSILPPREQSPAVAGTEGSPASAEAVRQVPADLHERLAGVFSSRFEVLQPVAIGGMATIFQMRHRLHGGLFALKVLHPDLAQRPRVVSSFQQEAAHASLLGGHPNAVPVFDFGEADGLHFMLMPFIEGEDLDRVLLRSGPFSREEALQMAGQVSSVLSHAERHGILHRDLSPGNLRLDRFGFYRLLDFGISTGPDSGGAPLTGATPLYASPERTAGSAPSLRDDLYALGAILLEVLLGKSAFHADTMEAIHQRHREGRWEVPASLPPEDPLLAVLRSLLAVDPADRPESAFEVSGMLDAAGYPRPEFRRTRPLDTLGKAPRRRLS